MGYQYGASRKATRPTIPAEELPRLVAVAEVVPPKPKPKPVLQPCGTNAAYNRHLSHYEDPCAPCKEARREYVADRRALPPEKRRRPVAKCGTYSGAIRHRRNKETPCTPCAEAHREYDRKRRAKKAREAAYNAAIIAHPEDVIEGPRRLALLNHEARHLKAVS